MALIKCPECGKEISDKARACIHCGYPIENRNLDINSMTNPSDTGYSYAEGMCTYYHIFNGFDKSIFDFILSKINLKWRADNVVGVPPPI